jgi:hypothetical protein
MACRALKSLDTSKKTTKLPSNDPFERILGLRKPGIDDRRIKNQLDLSMRKCESLPLLMRVVFNYHLI